VTFRHWLVRNLTFYWRPHLAVGLAVAVATAVLTGALVVGDSVKGTLRYALEARLGRTAAAIVTQDRFLTEDFARRLSLDPVAPVLLARGMVASGDGTVRVNQVQVLGVDERFFQLSPGGETPADFNETAGLWLNTALAARLNIVDWQGAEVVLRLDKPGLLSRDLVMSPQGENTIAARLPVRGRVDDAFFGRFSLAANQQVPLNVLVPLPWLQRQLGRAQRANLFLLAEPESGLTQAAMDQAVHTAWRLEDAEAAFTALPNETGLELRSSRVFLDASLGQAAGQIHPEAVGLLTYFVNELRVGERAAPYSMVTAVPRRGPFTAVLPEGMQDDQVVINQWLAEDLQARVGDRLELTYFLPQGAGRLEERTRAFTVCRIVPLAGVAADSSLMPDFPGLKDAEHCSEWDPGLPVDLDKIREQDETYWDDYRGTPKAFVTLAAGQALWANRYGDLTAVRFPVPPASRATLEATLQTHLDPVSLGIFATPVRSAGERARTQGTDFGQLFLGLSMFLMAAAVLLTGLLFVFSIQSRAGQTGLLLALGFPNARIRLLYLLEGCVVAGGGALLGTRLGLLYTHLLIYGLNSAWQGAVAGSAIRFHATGMSQLAGGGAGMGVALLAMLGALRKQRTISAHRLLSGNTVDSVTDRARPRRAKAGWAVSLTSLVAALLLLVLGSHAGAGVFFGAGTLLLAAMLTGLGQILRLGSRRRPQALSSLMSLSLRHTTRRAGRSLAVVAMLACGVFMVVAVGANRKNPAAGADRRASGTGGFALIGESAVPIIQDLNRAAGRKALRLDEAVCESVAFVCLRVRDGDDASCLNLNRAQQPRLLGVDPNAFSSRGAFVFQQQVPGDIRDWDLLHLDLGADVVPVIGDFPTVYWGLGKRLGDELIYRNQAGREVRLRFVGLLAGSVLQGNLVIAETRFTTQFPGIEGYRAFLIDVPAGREAAVSAHLTQRLVDRGMSLETTVARLRTFGQVENTYLSIFLVLGGLGLVLGCVGLGLIVIRNLLDRQGELAMLRAVGFSRVTLVKMVCWEHVLLLGCGLAVGVLCALLAVFPSLRMAGTQLPVNLLIGMVGLIALSGGLWVWLAARWILSGSILAPLRRE
jgi:ABC-type lipoprotein release transport system permease subunit